MNPYPFVALNHFTLPLTDACASGPRGPLLSILAMSLADAVPGRTNQEGTQDRSGQQIPRVLVIMRKSPRGAQQGGGGRSRGIRIKRCQKSPQQRPFPAD